ITSATERAIVIAGSGRPRVLGPTERQAPISRACPWRLDRSPLENDWESPISSAHVVPIYLVGLRQSLASFIEASPPNNRSRYPARVRDRIHPPRPAPSGGVCSVRASRISTYRQL